MTIREEKEGNNMSGCPCGCNRSIRKGCTYAMPACVHRVRGQAAAAARPKCQTCQKRLSTKDVARGVRRCETCRVDEPGRPSHHKPGAGSHFTINAKPKATKEKPDAFTWWLLPMTRDEFMDVAKRTHAGASAPSKGIALSPDGIAV